MCLCVVCNKNSITFALYLKHTIMNLKKLLNSGNNELEPIFDMARIGFIENDKLEVYVRTDDGENEPHFHIWDRSTRGKVLNTCVKIKTNEYFQHGGYQDTLNAAQRKALAVFMASKPKSSRYDTNYELVVDMWNLNNSSMDVDVKYDENGDVVIPDYTNISE